MEVQSILNRMKEDFSLFIFTYCLSFCHTILTNCQVMIKSQAWWHTPVIPTIWWQEDHKFKARLGNLELDSKGLGMQLCGSTCLTHTEPWIPPPVPKNKKHRGNFLGNRRNKYSEYFLLLLPKLIGL